MQPLPKPPSSLGSIVLFLHTPSVKPCCSRHPLLTSRWELFGEIRELVLRGGEQSRERQGIQTCGLTVKMECCLRFLGSVESLS